MGRNVQREHEMRIRPWTMLWVVVITVNLVAAGRLAFAAPMDQVVFEDFGGISTIVGDPFSIGTTHERAMFDGDAFSGVAGITELYRPGNSFAWMVNPGGTGTIQFQENAAEVEFYSRTRSNADGNTTITAFDEVGTVVGTPVTLTPADEWQLLSFTGNIDHIDVQNMASGMNQMNAIDDLGFTSVAIPEPSTLTILLAVPFALLVRRHYLF